MEDIDEYDKKCKVEPLMRALKESETEAWINGRRRDHGFERAALPLWEGQKVRQEEGGGRRWFSYGSLTKRFMLSIAWIKEVSPWGINNSM